MRCDVMRCDIESDVTKRPIRVMRVSSIFGIVADQPSAIERFVEKEA
jgi:hypothetical protein